MNTATTRCVQLPSAVTGQVKWFDSARGFGFVAVPGFAADFLLHQHVLTSFGRTSIADGSTVAFDYENSATGLRIVKVLAVEAPNDDLDPFLTATPEQVFDEKVPARVKWFDVKKGYGFVNRYGSNEDIFVGLNVLRKSTLGDLQVGEALCIQIAETEGRKSVYRIHSWV